jgi:hypothetical protein
VSGTATDTNGVQYKKFTDGTYGRFDEQGNYSPATAASFQAATDAQGVSDKIKSIQNGTFQLPANQQAQLDGLSSKYAALITAQATVNANTTGGMTLAQNMYGMGNTLIGQGEITKTVNDGIQKIADLQNTLASNLATMTDAFQKDDMAMLQTSYNSYEANQKSIQAEIDKQVAYVQAQQDKQDLKSQAYALAAAAKYKDTLEPISQYDTQAEVDRKVKTSDIWKADQEKLLGNIDPVAMQAMVSAYRMGRPAPLFRGTNASKQTEAFWAAVGNAPGTVSDAIRNQIALKAISSARDTQEKLATGTQSATVAMEGNMQVAQPLIDKIDKTNSAAINKYLLWTQGKLGAADPQTTANIAALDTALNAVAMHYSKIMAGSASSIAGTPVADQAAAKELINSSLSKMSLQEVFSILRQDAAIQTSSYNSTLNSLDSDTSTIASNATGSTGTTTSSTSTTGGTGYAEAW